MALHDSVVKRATRHYEAQGLDVMAELRGRKRPPEATGVRGRVYHADIFVPQLALAIEVKTRKGARYAGPKLKAIQDAPGVKQCMLVLCTGTPKGVAPIRKRLRTQGVRCRVVNYKELEYW
jgi:hypothetical protein